ncbi:tetratricopeptide repeat protein [Ramlibacter sp. G-1-2-2]|uniref:Tetratricopeptide repeat protein n=1 Tax=Ramlibacter agri TaxID=2728837 RepID=A0A848H235_9BURK|nr:tetratricopeptide repeat protein [Ramlibacter agri]
MAAADGRGLQALVALALDAGARGDYAGALQLLVQARAADPRNPELAFREGLARRALGDEAAALGCFDAALQLAPGHPAVLNARGLALKALGRADEALAAYEQALAKAPHFAEALNNRGALLRQQGRLDEAAASFQEAAAAQPNAAEIHNNLGWTLHLQGRHEDALACYARALQLRPGDARVLSNQGATLQALYRFDEAAAACEQALRADPGAWETWMNLGVARYGQRRPADALDAYAKAEALAPGAPELAVNRGNALQDLGRHEEALRAYAQALGARPDDAELEMNIANAWRELQRNELARPHYEHALTLAPGNADIHFNYGLSLLAAGDYERGWSENEWRWRAPGLGVPEPRYEAPKWLGREPLAGKTLLVHAEQGLGDTLLLVRFLPLLMARGARVLLRAQKPLRALLRETLPGIEVLGLDDALPAFDCWCPSMSLPLAFGTTLDTLPAAVPYLHPAPERIARWRAVLPTDRPNIGLAWSGNPGNAADRRRSLELASLLPALPEGPRYWCLQKDIAPADRAVMGERVAVFEENGFPDTAAQAVLMDAVVSVDTSIANLAGALGCRLYMLLAFSADFRWLAGREDSPWFPTAKLLRQEKAGDWSVPLARLAQLLV